MKDVFTLFEASAAIYLADAAGNATGSALWVGDCMQGIRIEENFEETEILNHGEPYKPVHHTGEDHVISWDRWYAVKDVADELVLPDLERNTQYVLVLVWHSTRERVSKWFKRVYFGVTARSQPLESGDAMTDHKTLRATYRRTVKGLASAPDLTAAIVGVVLFISAGLQTIAYTYDWDTAAYTSTGLVPAADCGINEGGTGIPSGTDWYLAIGGDPVLWLDGALRMTAVRALGTLAVVDDELDRVEFRFSETTYLAVQSDGLVIARTLANSATRPPGGQDFAIFDDSDDWQASLTSGGLRAIDIHQG